MTLFSRYRSLGMQIGCLLVVALLPLNLLSQEIHGRIVDQSTKEGISFASVYTYHNSEKIGTACDIDGRFTLALPSRLFKSDTLKIYVSSIGYKTRWVQRKKASTSEMGNITLEEMSEALDVVVVRPTKSKYSKKNNPAVELIERAIAQKDSNRIESFDNHSFTGYEKVLISQVGIVKGEKYWGIPKHKVEVWQDTSIVAQSRTMPLSLREKQWISASRNGKLLNPLITGRRVAGVEEAIDEGQFTENIDELFKEVDIYANNLKILGNEIPSPMNARWATTFYKYYITDTVQYQDTPCFQLQFLPMNARDAGFQGYVWIDTVHLSLRHVEMELPQIANVNWVDKLKFVFAFEPIETPRGSAYLPSRQSIASVFKPGKIFKSGLEILVDRLYHSYRFGEDALREEVLDPRVQLPSPMREDAMLIRSGSYGIVTRPVLLTEKEDKAIAFVDYLKNNFTYKVLSQTTRLFATGFLSVPLHTLKREQVLFDLGPYETMLGFNEIEGGRIRLGGMTTANLMQHWFLEGYVSYGTYDKKWKYYTRLSYTPLKRDYHIWEQPRNNLSLVVQHDFFILGEETSSMFKDGLLALWANRVNRLCYYGDRVSLSYEKDFSQEVRGLFWAEYFKKTSAGDLHYYVYDDQLQSVEIPSLTENQIGMALTWTPEGRTFASRRSGGKSGSTARYRPEVSLFCSLFPQSVLGNRHTYWHTSLAYSQRIFLSMWGRIDAMVQLSAAWGDTPQTSLFSPRTNRSWIARGYSFETLRPLEYIADRALHFRTLYFPNGLLFNRIPLINKLGLREVVGIEGYWGHLSDKARKPRAGLEVFSHESTSRMNNHLVLEGRVGIDNIFNVLGVEYIYRFTDRHLPLDQRQAVRLMFKVSF